MKWLLLLGLLACSGQNLRSVKSENCWDDRKTVEKLTDVEGVINKEGDWIAISTSATIRLFPCNLPDSFKPGDSVLFSAEQKEIFPNERWAGTPIELSSINLIRENQNSQR